MKASLEAGLVLIEYQWRPTYSSRENLLNLSICFYSQAFEPTTLDSQFVFKQLDAFCIVTIYAAYFDVDSCVFQQSMDQVM